jgi:hypothetical protein
MLFWRMLFVCILIGFLVPCHVSADAYVMTDENGNVLTDENGNVRYRDDNEGGGILSLLASLVFAVIAVKNGEPGAWRDLAILLVVVGITGIAIYMIFFHTRVRAYLQKRRSGKNPQGNPENAP